MFQRLEDSFAPPFWTKRFASLYVRPRTRGRCDSSARELLTIVAYRPMFCRDSETFSIFVALLVV